MSRSYRKNPVIRDSRRSKKTKKRIANRKLRRAVRQNHEVVGKYNNYKKYYPSWIIADFISRWTEKDAIEYYNNHCRVEYYVVWHIDLEYCEQMVAEFKKRYPTLEDFLLWYRKLYLYK